MSWFDMSGTVLRPADSVDMGRGRKLADEVLASRKPFSPEICVLVIPRVYWMRSTPANSALVLNQVVTMPQSGAPWDFVLDERIGLASARLQAVRGAQRVLHGTPRREAIRAVAAQRHCTFVYAPAILARRAIARSVAGPDRNSYGSG